MRLTRAGFLASATSSLLLPQKVRAQAFPRPCRIGLLAQFPLSRSDPFGNAFWNVFDKEGLVLGRDFLIEERLSPDNDANFARLARELVEAKVHLIVTITTMAAIEARKATSTIPIVALAAANPERLGLIESIAHPAGNLTGMSDVLLDNVPKSNQIMKDAFPQCLRPALFWNSENPCHALILQEGNLPAVKALGLTPIPVAVRNRGDLDKAIATCREERADLIVPFITMTAYLDRILEYANAERIPTFGAGSWFADAGVLVTYGPDYVELLQKGAQCVLRVMRGARPGELPVQEPAKYELVVNLKAAKALGVQIGPLVVARASRVIE
jgi:putative ABC transport system substrate-binding protein